MYNQSLGSHVVRMSGAVPQRMQSIATRWFLVLYNLAADIICVDCTVTIDESLSLRFIVLDSVPIDGELEVHRLEHFDLILEITISPILG